MTNPKRSILSHSFAKRKKYNTIPITIPFHPRKRVTAMVGMRPASCGVSCTFHFDGSMMLLWFDDGVRSPPVVDAAAGSVIVKAIAGLVVVCLLVSDEKNWVLVPVLLFFINHTLSIHSHHIQHGRRWYGTDTLMIRYYCTYILWWVIRLGGIAEVLGVLPHNCRTSRVDVNSVSMRRIVGSTK